MTPTEELISKTFDLERVRFVANDLCNVMSLRDPEAKRPRSLEELQAATAERWERDKDELLLLAIVAIQADRLFASTEPGDVAWRNFTRPA